MGTPKDLDAAIMDVFTTFMSSGPDQSHAVLKDFLAQRFGAAMLEHPECENVLKELFDGIVKRAL